MALTASGTPLASASRMRFHAPTGGRNRAMPMHIDAAHDHLRRMSDAFAPPKPNELVNAYSTFAPVGFCTT